MDIFPAIFPTRGVKKSEASEISKQPTHRITFNTILIHFTSTRWLLSLRIMFTIFATQKLGHISIFKLKLSVNIVVANCQFLVWSLKEAYWHLMTHGKAETLTKLSVHIADDDSEIVGQSLAITITPKCLKLFGSLTDLRAHLFTSYHVDCQQSTDQSYYEMMHPWMSRGYSYISQLFFQ